MRGKGKLRMESRSGSRIEAFHVTEEELNMRGWTAAGLPRMEALALVREFCPGLVESVRVYHAADGALLLVEWRAVRPIPRQFLRRGRVRRHPT